MSISDIDKIDAGKGFQTKDSKSMVRSSIVNFSLAVLCAVFYIIYIQFSYGVDSIYMRCMFAPTFAGACISLLLYFTKLGEHITRISYNLWNAASAVVTLGLLFKGIVSISGRFTNYQKIYWVAAAVLAFAAVSVEVVYVVTLCRKKERTGK